MRTSFLKLIVGASLVMASSVSHTADLPTTTAHIKRIQKEIQTIRARQKREADLVKWYRDKEAALAKLRDKPWQIIPSAEERKQSRAAKAIEVMIQQDEKAIDNYELSIRRYAWAYVVIYDPQANKNLLIAKNLVPYIEEGQQVMQQISDAKDAINDAQMKETVSTVSNIFGARSAATFSSMGSRATIDARTKAQAALRKSVLYLAKINAGGKAVDVSENADPITKNGPAYNAATKAINSVLALESLSDAYAELEKSEDNIDIVVSTLIDDVHMLENKNDKIAVDLANKILRQTVAQ